MGNAKFHLFHKILHKTKRKKLNPENPKFKNIVLKKKTKYLRNTVI